MLILISFEEWQGVYYLTATLRSKEVLFNNPGEFKIQNSYLFKYKAGTATCFYLSILKCLNYTFNTPLKDSQ